MKKIKKINKLLEGTPFFVFFVISSFFVKNLPHCVISIKSIRSIRFLFLMTFTLDKNKINSYLYFTRKFQRVKKNPKGHPGHSVNKSVSESVNNNDYTMIPANAELERGLYSLIYDFNNKLSTRNRQVKLFSNFSEYARMIKIRNYFEFFNKYYIKKNSPLINEYNNFENSSRYLRDYFQYQYLAEMDRIPSLFEVRMFKEILVKFNNLSYEDQILFLKLILEYERFKISILDEANIEQSNDVFNNSLNNIEILEDLLEYQYEMFDPMASVHLSNQKKAYEEKVQNQNVDYHQSFIESDVKEAIETKNSISNERFSDDFNPISWKDVLTEVKYSIFTRIPNDPTRYDWETQVSKKRLKLASRLDRHPEVTDLTWSSAAPNMGEGLKKFWDGLPGRIERTLGEDTPPADIVDQVSKDVFYLYQGYLDQFFNELHTNNQLRNINTVLNSQTELNIPKDLKEFFLEYSVLFDKFLYLLYSNQRNFFSDFSILSKKTMEKTIYNVENSNDESSNILLSYKKYELFLDKVIYNLFYASKFHLNKNTAENIQNYYHAFPTSFNDLYKQIVNFYDTMVYHIFLYPREFYSSVYESLKDNLGLQSDDLFVQRVLQKKYFNYVPATDSETGESVLLVYKDKKWVEVIDYATYLYRIRQDKPVLLREREIFLQEAEGFYNIHRNASWDKRAVFWMKISADDKNFDYNINKWDYFYYFNTQAIEAGWTLNWLNTLTYEKLWLIERWWLWVIYHLEYYSVWGKFGFISGASLGGWVFFTFFIYALMSWIPLQFALMQRLVFLFIKVDHFFIKHTGKVFWYSEHGNFLFYIAVFFNIYQYFLFGNYETPLRLMKIEREEKHKKLFSNFKLYRYHMGEFDSYFNINTYKTLPKIIKNKMKGTLNGKSSIVTTDTFSNQSSLSSRKEYYINSKKGNLGYFTNIQFVLQQELYILFIYIKSFYILWKDAILYFYNFKLSWLIEFLLLDIKFSHKILHLFYLFSDYIFYNWIFPSSIFISLINVKNIFFYILFFIKDNFMFFLYFTIKIFKEWFLILKYRFLVFINYIFSDGLLFDLNYIINLNINFMINFLKSFYLDRFKKDYNYTFFVLNGGRWYNNDFFYYKIEDFIISYVIDRLDFIIDFQTNSLIRQDTFTLEKFLKFFIEKWNFFILYFNNIDFFWLNFFKKESSNQLNLKIVSYPKINDWNDFLDIKEFYRSRDFFNLVSWEDFSSTYMEAYRPSKIFNRHKLKKNFKEPDSYFQTWWNWILDIVFPTMTPYPYYSGHTMYEFELPWMFEYPLDVFEKLKIRAINRTSYDMFAYYDKLYLKSWVKRHLMLSAETLKMNNKINAALFYYEIINYISTIIRFFVDVPALKAKTYFKTFSLKIEGYFFSYQLYTRYIFCERFFSFNWWISLLNWLKDILYYIIFNFDSLLISFIDAISVDFVKRYYRVTKYLIIPYYEPYGGYFWKWLFFYYMKLAYYIEGYVYTGYYFINTRFKYFRSENFEFFFHKVWFGYFLYPWTACYVYLKGIFRFIVEFKKHWIKIRLFSSKHKHDFLNQEYVFLLKFFNHFFIKYTVISLLKQIKYVFVLFYYNLYDFLLYSYFILNYILIYLFEGSYLNFIFLKDIFLYICRNYIFYIFIESFYIIKNIVLFIFSLINGFFNFFYSNFKSFFEYPYLQYKWYYYSIFKPGFFNLIYSIYFKLTNKDLIVKENILLNQNKKDIKNDLNKNNSFNSNKENILNYQIALEYLSRNNLEYFTTKHPKTNKEIILHYPLTPDEQILDNAGLLNRFERNIWLESKYHSRYSSEFLDGLINYTKIVNNTTTFLNVKFSLDDYTIYLPFILEDIYIEIPKLRIFDTLYINFFNWCVYFKKVIFDGFISGELSLSLLVYLGGIPHKIYEFFVYDSIIYFKNIFSFFMEGFYFIKNVLLYLYFYVSINYGFSLSTLNIETFKDVFLYKIFNIPFYKWKGKYKEVIYSNSWKNMVILNEWFKKINFKDHFFLKSSINLWLDYYINFWKLKSNNKDFSFYYLITSIKISINARYDYFWKKNMFHEYPKLWQKYILGKLNDQLIVDFYFLKLKYLILFCYVLISDIILFIFDIWFGHIGLFFKNFFLIPVRFYSFSNRIYERLIFFYIKMSLDLKAVYFIFKSEFCLLINYDLLSFYFLKYSKIFFFYLKIFLDWYIIPLDKKFNFNLYEYAFAILYEKNVFTKAFLYSFGYLIENMSITLFLNFFLIQWNILKELFYLTKRGIFSLFNFLYANLVEFCHLNNIFISIENIFLNKCWLFYMNIKHKYSYRRFILYNIFESFLIENFIDNFKIWFINFKLEFFSKTFFEKIILISENFILFFYIILKWISQLLINIFSTIQVSIIWIIEDIVGAYFLIFRFILYFIKYIFLIIDYLKGIFLSVLFLTSLSLLQLIEFFFKFLKILIEYFINVILEFCIIISEILLYIMTNIILFNDFFSYFYTFFEGFWKMLLNLYAFFTKKSFYDIDYIVINFHMFIIDVWYSMTGNFWWENKVLLNLFQRFQPLRQWLIYNFRINKNTEKILISIRGDKDRFLPENFSSKKLSPNLENDIAWHFGSPQQDLYYPAQLQDFWELSMHINYYAEMLNDLNLPYPMKIFFYRLFCFELFLEASHTWYTNPYTYSSKRPSFSELEKFFDKIFENQNIFNDQNFKLKFTQLNLITNQNYFSQAYADPSYLPEDYQEDEEDIGEDDFLERNFLEYLMWSTFKDDLRNFAFLEYFSDGTPQEVYFDEDVIIDFRDMVGYATLADAEYNQLLLKTVLAYYIELTDALEQYDFFVFNQKIYNFYLDMFGPEFAKIYYHFPGQALVLNDSNLTTKQRIEWLLGYLNKQKPSYLSNTSFTHWIHDETFNSVFRAAEGWSLYNMFIRDFTFNVKKDPDDIDFLWYGHRLTNRQKPHYIFPGNKMMDNFNSFMYLHEELFDLQHFDHEAQTDDIHNFFRQKETISRSTLHLWDDMNEVMGFHAGIRIPFEPLYKFSENFHWWAKNPYWEMYFTKTKYTFSLDWETPSQDFSIGGPFTGLEMLGLGRSWDLGVIYYRETMNYINQKSFQTEIDGEWIEALADIYTLRVNTASAWVREAGKWWLEELSEQTDEIESKKEEYLLEYLKKHKILPKQNDLMSYMSRSNRYSFGDAEHDLNEPDFIESDFPYEILNRYFHVFDIFHTLPEMDSFIIPSPYLDIMEFYNIMNDRMINKPNFYKFWVFYDEQEVAATNSNIQQIAFLSKDLYDAPTSWQYGFQDPASPIMEGIIDLHHDLVFFMILISVGVCWVLMNIISNFISTNYPTKLNNKALLKGDISFYYGLVIKFFLILLKLVFMLNFLPFRENLIQKLIYYITILKNKQQLTINAQDELLKFQNFYINYYLGQVNGLGPIPEKYLNELVLLNNIKEFNSVTINADTLNLLTEYVYYFKGITEITDKLVSTSKEYLVKDLSFFATTLSESDDFVVKTVMTSPDFNPFFPRKQHLQVLKKMSIKFSEEPFKKLLKSEFVWFPELFTHHTMIEVIWTIIPALILIMIALPSFSLLFAMDQIWPAAFTIKVIGNQWYWSYEYC